MLSQSEVEAIFKEHLPDTVRLTFIERVMYVRTSMTNPFIQQQIAVGIYDEENIFADFLSPARSYPAFSELGVCYDLLSDYAVGVPDALTTAYVTRVAVHEAHHFERAANPMSVHDHVHNELDCIAAVANSNPALEKLADQFEALSPVYQRVYARMELLREGVR